MRAIFLQSVRVCIVCVHHPHRLPTTSAYKILLGPPPPPAAYSNPPAIMYSTITVGWLEQKEHKSQRGGMDFGQGEREFVQSHWCLRNLQWWIRVEHLTTPFEFGHCIILRLR